VGASVQVENVALSDAAHDNGGAGVCDPPREVCAGSGQYHRHIAHCLQRLNVRKTSGRRNWNMILVEKIVPVARERLVTVRDDALLAEAGRFLDGRHINLVVVCDKGGAMVGIITRTDVVRQISLFLGQGCGCTVPVAMAMTRDVTYCCPSDLLVDVWSIMKERKLLHIPIVGKDFRPLGVLNARDALLVLLEASEHEGALLREYVMGIGYH
jgi:CBS domain-containing protein